MEFKLQQVRPGFAESCSKMYILPTLTYLEVGGPADASKFFIFEHFKWEPIAWASAACRGGGWGQPPGREWGETGEKRPAVSDPCRGSDLGLTGHLS